MRIEVLCRHVCRAQSGRLTTTMGVVPQSQEPGLPCSFRSVLPLAIRFTLQELMDCNLHMDHGVWTECWRPIWRPRYSLDRTEEKRHNYITRTTQPQAG